MDGHWLKTTKAEFKKRKMMMKNMNTIKYFWRWWWKAGGEGCSGRFISV